MDALFCAVRSHHDFLGAGPNRVVRTWGKPR
jgi:hypothetical protein